MPSILSMTPPCPANINLEIEKGKWDFVIDNVHNPIVKKDWEIAPESKIVIWRNFPIKLEEKTLIRMLESNLEKLLVFQ